MPSIAVFGQLQVSDSLRRSLPMANDTSKVNMMISLSDYYLGSNPDSAVYWSSEAIQVSRKIFSDLHEARSFNQLGRSYSEKVDHQSALFAHNQALEIFRSNNYFEGIFNSLTHKDEGIKNTFK